ncbi:MAG: hypothetical protein COB81_05170 [Flavobacteriaceae bacterium]|nr:MAG: hypothetical protein COB81_05170 [Flavobacteriaceae bacterium]
MKNEKRKEVFNILNKGTHFKTGKFSTGKFFDFEITDNDNSDKNTVEFEDIEQINEIFKKTLKESELVKLNEKIDTESKLKNVDIYKSFKIKFLLN